MEFRELQYFLAVVKEGTISGAAGALHVAQPSLSRQMRELEEKIGTTLFVRGNRKITLTEDGLILQRRANEIVQLMQKTEQELGSSKEDMSGDIYIGAAEANAVHYLTRAAASLLGTYPNIRFHIASGDTTDTKYQLEQGLIDFALLFYPYDLEKYNYIRLPVSDRMVALMRKDHPLSEKHSVSLRKDLKNEPLILSRLAQGMSVQGIDTSSLHIIGTYNLAYNASIMVEDGLGIALCFDSIVNINDRNNLCIVPVSDMGTGINPAIIWKKYQAMTPIAKAYIDELHCFTEQTQDYEKDTL